MIKILYIACGSGSNSTVGGSLLRTVEIAKRIGENEKTFLLTSSGGRQAVKHILNDESIIEIKTNICKSNNETHYLIKLFISYLILLFRTWGVVKHINKVNLIYLDSDGLWDIFPALLYKRIYPDVKIVSMNHHIITIRNDSIFAFLSSTINVILQKIGQHLISKIADAIFVLNTNMGGNIKLLYRRLGYMSNIYKVKNGVNVKSIVKIPNQQKEYDACFFGYLRPSKGLYQIVPIWEMVVKKIPSAKLIIIGGIMGQYEKILTKEIDKKKLNDNIIMTHYIENKRDALLLVKKSKISISLSQEEGWGIALIECMAAGIPSIIWNLSTFQKILNNGVIKVKKYNTSVFAKHIVELLNDDKERNKLGKQAKKEVIQYDWVNIASQDLNYFNKIIRN